MLMAQRFNADALALVGELRSIAEIPSGQFSVSPNGVLAYQSGTDANRSNLAWFDRTGKLLGAVGEEANHCTVELSPDGSRAAGGIPEQVNSLAGDVWLHDLKGNGRTRLTFDAANTLAQAIWSPDARRLVYMKKRQGQSGFNLFQRAADGAGAEQPLLEDQVNKQPLSWSPEGKSLLYLLRVAQWHAHGGGRQRRRAELRRGIGESALRDAHDRRLSVRRVGRWAAVPDDQRSGLRRSHRDCRRRELDELR